MTLVHYLRDYTTENGRLVSCFMAQTEQIKKYIWRKSQPELHTFHVRSFLSVEDLQDDCQSATAKVFRFQKILEGMSFDILATAVSRSPSVLGSIEAEKAQRVVKLSGTVWPSDDPKVLYLYIVCIIFKLNQTV